MVEQRACCVVCVGFTIEIACDKVRADEGSLRRVETCRRRRSKSWLERHAADHLRLHDQQPTAKDVGQTGARCLRSGDFVFAVWLIGRTHFLAPNLNRLWINPVKAAQSENPGKPINATRCLHGIFLHMSLLLCERRRAATEVSIAPAAANHMFPAWWVGRKRSH